MVLWGTFLRVTVGLHATWLVNSATHLWGKRRFETKDDSRNNWWVALLTGGEGWHNNHHAHPVSARHGLTWYEFDINYYGIWLLCKIGLAEKDPDRQVRSQEPQARRRHLSRSATLESNSRPPERDGFFLPMHPVNSKLLDNQPEPEYPHLGRIKHLISLGSIQRPSSG